MADTFHINGLVNVRHSPETKKILEEVEDKSKFIRDKILEFAKQRGFKWQSNGKIPEFMSDNKWNEYQELMKKSTKTKKKIKVDYTYIIAFYWLKSSAKFQYANDATLQRLIILDK